MWAFERRLARLPTTLSFTTTINTSYWRLGMATRSAPVCPSGSFFFIYTPLIQKVTDRFSISFLWKMRRLFLVRYWKVRKNHTGSFFDISEKHEGSSRSAPPLPGRGLKVFFYISDTQIHLKIRFCSFLELAIILTCFIVCYLLLAPKLGFWQISWQLTLFDQNRCAVA